MSLLKWYSLLHAKGDDVTEPYQSGILASLATFGNLLQIQTRNLLYNIFPSITCQLTMRM